MNKQELVSVVAEKTGFTKKDLTLVLEEFLGTMTDALVEGNEVSLFGFGKFVVSEKAETTARNPKTGLPVIVKAHNVVRFKPSSNLKNELNK